MSFLRWLRTRPINGFQIARKKNPICPAASVLKPRQRGRSRIRIPLSALSAGNKSVCIGLIGIEFIVVVVEVMGATFLL
jgi:hypothetical protein